MINTDKIHYKNLYKIQRVCTLVVQITTDNYFYFFYLDNLYSSVSKKQFPIQLNYAKGKERAAASLKPIHSFG